VTKKKSNSKKTFYEFRLNSETYLKGKYPSIFKTKKRNSGPFIYSSFPDRNVAFADLGFKKNDDSLLNIEEKVPGETLSLSDVTTKRVNKRSK